MMIIPDFTARVRLGSKVRSGYGAPASSGDGHGVLNSFIPEHSCPSCIIYYDLALSIFIVTNSETCGRLLQEPTKLIDRALFFSGLHVSSPHILHDLIHEFHMRSDTDTFVQMLLMVDG